MAKPRVIIAETDFKYMATLQQKFIEEYFDMIDLEIISSKEYFNELFMTPQSADVLIVSENLYSSNLKRHGIGNIFLMKEKENENQEDERNVISILKYSRNINDIFNAIVGRSADLLRKVSKHNAQSHVIVFCSGSGGTGKTTVAMGVGAFLSNNYKKVLYIDAQGLQSFQSRLIEKNPISSIELYVNLGNADDNIYSQLKQYIRTECFNYIPPFKASLMALGAEFSLYEKLIKGAKSSKEYDYIIVDTDNIYDAEKIGLLDIADKTVVLTKKTKTAMYATNMLSNVVNIYDTDKFTIVCNDCADKSPISTSGCNFSISEYIGHIENCDSMSVNMLSQNKDMEKISCLIMK